jgi:hypothetical protein
LNQAEAKKAEELIEKGKEPSYVPVDKAIKQPERFVIYYNEA